MKTAIVDGDPLVYRIGFATEEETEDIARMRLSSFLKEMLLMEIDTTQWYGYLTGTKNFRNDIAVTAPYKGQRTGKRPKHYDALRRWLLESWHFEVHEGLEADDCVAMKATELAGTPFVICSIDKDLDQLIGEHYNYVKKEFYTLDERQATLNFYRQILTGDRIDNIIGIKGIGIRRADKILKDCNDAAEMFKACVDAYEGNVDRVVENARLLWLKRSIDDEWKPPT